MTMTAAPKILLVPVDGSEGSGKAAALAAHLAGKLDVPLRLLFAFPEDAVEAFGLPVTSNSAQYKYFSPDAFAQLRDQSAEQAFKAARDAMGEAGVSVEQEVVSGIAAPAILEYVSGVSDPMIVIGSRGLGRVKELVIGSVSQRILHHAGCPVLVVH